MKRLAVLWMFLAGCSTNPCADLLDWMKPAKPALAKGAGHGGVCQPAPVMGVPAMPPNGSGQPPGVAGPPPVAGPGLDDRLPPIEPPPPVR